MVYITGDTHRDFGRVVKFCDKMKTTTDDILIILGDAGINYYLNHSDNRIKNLLSRLPITLFCIHGNHEARPETIDTYELVDWHGGKVYMEKKYPNLVFAKDGEIYQFETVNGIKNCVVIGGAYSVDKYYRLRNGWEWFADEQPNVEIKQYVEDQLHKVNWTVDVVLTHTCPIKYEPIEWFLSGLDQSKVDKSTEIWLNKIEEKLNYKKWYCGHYHGNKVIDKMCFMFEPIDEFI